MVVCLVRGSDLHMAQWIPLPLTVSCFSKIQIGFAFLVPAHPGSPGQRAVKRVCVCVFLTYLLCRVVGITRTTTLLLHLFNRLFSRTTWISRYQKGKTGLDINEARDAEVLGCSGISWTICKQSASCSRQITTPTPHHSIFTGRMLFLTPNQQRQSTEGTSC